MFKPGKPQLFILVLTGLLWSAASFAAEITVFAAASLQDALDEAKADYESTHPGDKITASYAASSALAKQIESGAPASMFISADLQWMDYVDRKHLIQRETRKNILGNRLVLIAPADSSASVELVQGTDLAKILGSEYLAVGDPDSVPAGKYAKAALEWMGSWNSVVPKLARAENARSALAFVALRECPLGIVYASDARAEPRVRTVGVFPPEAHSPIIYPMALTRTGSSSSDREFYQFLLSPQAKEIFQRHGFIALE